MKVTLEKNRPTPSLLNNSIQITRCLPFVLNDRANLIHRPRTATIYKLKNSPPHMAIRLWCGNTFTGDKELSFIGEPPAGRFMCQKCEDKAMHAGLPASEYYVGKPVKIGRFIAVDKCKINED